MRRCFGIAVAILSASLPILPVRAATPCAVCGAMSQLHECDDTDLAHPSTGAVGVVGTVVEAFTGACDRDMAVDVIR